MTDSLGMILGLMIIVYVVLVYLFGSIAESLEDEDFDD